MERPKGELGTKNDLVLYRLHTSRDALNEKAYKRHKDAIGNFNKDYVKTEIFSREIGRKIGEAEEIRHASDYDDFYIASREETERQIEVADEFIQMVEEYCMRQLENG